MFLFHEVVQAILRPEVLEQRGYQHENTQRCRGIFLTGIPHEQEIPAPVTTTIRLLFVTASDKFRSALLTDASLAPVSNGSVTGMVGVWSTTVRTAGGGEVMWPGTSGKSTSPLEAISIIPYFPKTRYLSSRGCDTNIVFEFPKRATNNTRLADATRLWQQHKEGAYKLSSATYLVNSDLSRTNFMFTIGAPLIVVNIGRTGRVGIRVKWFEVTKLLLRGDQKGSMK